MKRYFLPDKIQLLGKSLTTLPAIQHVEKSNHRIFGFFGDPCVLTQQKFKLLPDISDPEKAVFIHFLAQHKQLSSHEAQLLLRLMTCIVKDFLGKEFTRQGLDILKSKLNFSIHGTYTTKAATWIHIGLFWDSSTSLKENEKMNLTLGKDLILFALALYAQDFTEIFETQSRDIE